MSSTSAWHVGSPPPKIDPHSLVKHQLVRDYLARYIQVLMSNYLIEKLTLSIVDGFAGGGEYLAEDGSQFHDGSPLIALNTVEQARAELNVGRAKPRKVDAKFYFIEKLASNFDYLNALIGTRLAQGRVCKDVVLLKQAFQDAVGPVMADIASRAGGERANFLLDQYAYDQVPGPLLRTIFSKVKGAEVILTFNVDSLITFLSDKDKCRAKLQQIGLDRYINWRTLEGLKNSSPAAWRSAIQRNLAKGLVEESGARHHTIFYITPSGSTSWTYWLVHLSNSFKARDVMMDQSPEKGMRPRYWLFKRSGADAKKALRPLTRFIVTPEVSKYRVFAWLTRGDSPDKNLVAIARADEKTMQTAFKAALTMNVSMLELQGVLAEQASMLTEEQHNTIK